MNYAQIRNMDVSDGPGIRVALYVSGCQFHCKNCYSQEQWNYKYGETYTAEIKEKIVKLLDNPHVRGLSILGGDPLWQYVPDIHLALIPLVKQVKAIGKDVWIWSGFTWEQIMKDHPESDPWNRARKKLISICDVWVDGLFQDELKDLRLQYRGSSNQRVIDVQASIEKNEPILLPILR